jgi:Fatty acid hydroxylase superfamily
MHVLPAVCAALAYLFVADFVYALDHYLVHHDRERYRLTHGRHHRRYDGAKDAPHLDGYELSTYTSAFVVAALGMSALALVTGNPGFLVGACLKYLHSLVFHYVQHAWWGEVPLRAQRLGRPPRSWGFVSARSHAFHHSHPGDSRFAFAEIWSGHDRLLEWAHPWLQQLTKNAQRSTSVRSA